MHKVTAVAEKTLPILAKSAGATLPAWNMDDCLSFCLLFQKRRQVQTAQVADFYGRIAEVVSSQLSSMTDTQLIKVAIVIGRVPACKEFLESMAEAAVGRVSNMPQAQLMLLTQGFASLGGGNAHFGKILDGWAASGADESKNTLSADQLAKLAASVATAAPDHTVFWNFVGTQLANKAESLTDAGWASVQATFPDGAGPSFDDKTKLLDVHKAKEEKKKKEEEEKKKKEDDEKKRAEEKKRSRYDDRDRDRDRDRRDDRDRDRRDDRRDDRDRDRRDRDRRDDRDRDRRDDRRRSRSRRR